MTVDELANRIDDLERSNRRLRRAVCAIVVANGLVLFVAAGPARQSASLDSLSVQKLLVVDGAGKTRMELSVGPAPINSTREAAAELKFLRAGGEIQGSFGGSGWFVSDAGSKASCSSILGGPSLMLMNKLSSSVELSAKRNHGYLQLLTPDGNFIELAAGAGKTHLHLTDALGMHRDISTQP
jgi:hypothetical protein